MPFTYYGGKKGLARHYPPPAYGTIIEPFAGSAGYALHWATPNHRVILIEKDPAIVALWHRLQAPDAAEDLFSVDCPAEGVMVTDPLLLLTQSGAGGNAKASAQVPFAPFIAAAARQFQTGLAGRPFQVTSRMARDWPAHRQRIATAIPRIRNWTIIHGDYADAPDVRGCWFIDPPYWVPATAEAGRRGDGYRHGASAIDFDALGAWCKTRKGQVIVCEQEGATWLPFRPLRRMTTAAGDGGRRTEVVWTRTPTSLVATPKARAAAEAAKKRRAARMAR